MILHSNDKCNKVAIECSEKIDACNIESADLRPSYLLLYHLGQLHALNNNWDAQRVGSVMDDSANVWFKFFVMHIRTCIILCAVFPTENIVLVSVLQICVLQVCLMHLMILLHQVQEYQVQHWDYNYSFLNPPHP